MLSKYFPKVEKPIEYGISDFINNRHIKFYIRSQVEGRKAMEGNHQLSFSCRQKRMGSGSFIFDGFSSG